MCMRIILHNLQSCGLLKKLILHQTQSHLLPFVMSFTDQVFDSQILHGIDTHVYQIQFFSLSYPLPSLKLPPHINNSILCSAYVHVHFEGVFHMSKYLTFCRIALFLARVCIPSQWPRFFKIARSEKLLVVLSARRITYMCMHTQNIQYNIHVMTITNCI